METYFEQQKIWQYLMDWYQNPYGVAGLMGNLFAESSLSPACVTGGKLRSKDAKTEYIQKVKDGKITPEEFTHDGIAFGLAQWRYWSRKEALFLYMRENNYEIDDLNGQLGFLCEEIATYKTVANTLKNATSIKEASDIVMERYEKPANMSEQAKTKRENFGHEFYDLFAYDKEVTPLYPKTVITTKAKVNLRYGNDYKYPAMKQTKKVGEQFKWVATAENGWHAIEVETETTRRVLWIAPGCSKLQSG